MKIAVVVGTVVASHKEPNLEGSRLLILKNVTIDGQAQNDYVVAVDAVNAGPGEYVLYAGGSSARQTEATHNRPVKHDRPMSCPILTHVFSAQALGHGEIHLNGAALPLTANGILQGVFNLWTVKSAVTLRNDVVATRRFQALHQSMFCAVPTFI